MTRIGFRDIFWPVLGIASITFHLWLIFAGLVPNLISRPLHMAFALPWIFLLSPKGQPVGITAWLFCLVGLVGCGWVAFHQSALGDQYGILEGSLQTIMAAALLCVALEMARRAVGWPLPLIAAITLLYGLYGNLIPGEFGHSGMP